MSKTQGVVGLVLAAAVSFFAGAALPETLGSTVGHALSFAGGSALFLGLFYAYNRANASGDCGCPGARPSDPSPLLPPDVTKQPKQLKPDGCQTGNCSHTEAEHGKPAPKAKKPKVDPNAIIGVRQFGSKFRSHGNGSSYLEVETVPQEDGSLKVTVVSVGYSGRDFKDRIRPRLEKIGGIKWQHPSNLGENRRQLDGSIPKGGNANAVLGAIEQVK